MAVREENGMQIYIILGLRTQCAYAVLVKQTDKAEAVWDVLIWENVISSKIEIAVIQAGDTNWGK